MQPSDFRVALFTGNYNYVRDGANQALNRLVDYLLRQGAQVRTYSPTVENPAFEATGDLVSVPSIPFPFRPEYRLPLMMSPAIRRDVQAFAPNIVHIASPDIVSHRAVTWARRRDIPAVASVHTRFDTYLSYYHLERFEPNARAIMRRLYRRCDAILVPAESTAAVMRAQRMNPNIFIWTRGVDSDQFNPEARDLEWRRSLGIADGELVVAFLGRVVMEKGLDVFADTIDVLAERGVAHRVMVIGEGPARPWFEERLPQAVFLGEQDGPDLGRALASADLLFNPSTTETFGNVTLEAMACGLPVIAAHATGAASLVANGRTGILHDATDSDGFADAIEAYARDPELRRRHGEAGLEFARTQDWDRINASVFHVYQYVLERKHRRSRLMRR